ncbi:antibiotic biosynthesis monooxygenase family protein [Nubsella zeaxanthinifaciens]|uniref:antibiotic biosynthesis monooxygenase family protein n=1 Tax=Nubsella zeaxanthinifaciens TaxID=392412 RepID=UPI000DE3529A|nr:antibiotic biosynthesis monooxygenase [Nubsella zeaxanthinifaciens]
MILEVAILNVIPTLTAEFEVAFSKAEQIIAGMHGYISHQLQKCIEDPAKYILLVNWTDLEAHTIGFRRSAEYQEWKALLHHFYDPFPTVEHYEKIQGLR